MRSIARFYDRRRRCVIATWAVLDGERHGRWAAGSAFRGELIGTVASVRPFESAGGRRTDCPSLSRPRPEGSAAGPRYAECDGREVARC